MRAVSVSNILAEWRDEKSSAGGIVLAGTFLLLYLAVFFWASGRGFEFSDEALYLLDVSDPSAYVDVTNFGDVWHLFFLAVNGSIAATRVIGLAVLALCSVLFAFSVLRFSGQQPPLGKSGIATIFAVTAGVSWQYTVWKPTPDYNSLNLCALLLFLSGLLFASSHGNAAKGGPSVSRGIMGPVLLCAAGVALMALTKATTAVLAVLLGLVWVAVVRVERPVISLLTAAAIAAALLAIAMIMIDGSVAEFVNGKAHAFFIMSSGTDGDVHGIKASVTNTFAKPAWRVAQAASCTAVLFALALIWSSSVLSDRSRTASRLTPYVVATIIAAIVFFWRNQDLQIGQPFMGYRLWRMPLFITLAAFALRVLWPLRHSMGERTVRIVSAAMILAVAPVAYSFGTQALLIWHMIGAGIFWIAGIFVLSVLAPAPVREDLPQAIAYLVSATAIALLLSVMTVPGRIGAPVWEQSVPVSLGIRPSSVSVNPQAAEYIQAFQREAHENGFRAGMPTIDASEVGLGLSIALGARPLGSPPWLVTNSGLATEAERRGSVISNAPDIRAQLADVPVAELRRAWVISGNPDYLPIIKPYFRSLGIDFPDGYRVVTRVTRGDFGSTQVLWKPVN